jgi:hypothetical protein
MERRTGVASSIRMTIGPRNGDAPAAPLRVPALPWRPAPVSHPRDALPEQEPRTKWKTVADVALADLPFRLAIVLMIGLGAIFVWVTWPQAVVPSAIPSPTATALSTARPPEPTSSATAATVIRHVIQSGETLRSLATRYYGNEGRWPVIYEANRSVIPDPENLSVGVEIVIPPD